MQKSGALERVAAEAEDVHLLKEAGGGIERRRPVQEVHAVRLPRAAVVCGLHRWGRRSLLRLRLIQSATDPSGIIKLFSK